LQRSRHDDTPHEEMPGRADPESAPMKTASEPAAASAQESTSLPEVARRASLAAERVAIQQVLQRMRWNRRKAAVALGVSYKTLLNKMKECGITAPD